MIKTGGILAIIGGILGLLAGFVTLFFGGLSEAFSTSNASTVVGLGWGVIVFSLLSVVYGAIALSKPKAGAIGLMLSATFGVVLGGTIVAIVMVLVLISGILVAIGYSKNKHLSPSSSKAGLWIATLIPILVAAMIGAQLAGFGGNATQGDDAKVFNLGETAKSNSFEITLHSVEFFDNIGKSFAAKQAPEGSTFAAIKMTVRCIDSESRYFSNGNLFAEVDGKQIKYDNTEFNITVDSPIGMINPLTEKTGYVIYLIPKTLMNAQLSWMPSHETPEIKFNLNQQLPSTQQAQPVTSQNQNSDKNWAGKYVASNLGDGNQGEFEISVKSGQFNISLNVVNGQGNTGEATGALQVQGENLLFKDAEFDCLLSFNKTKNGIHIKQDGGCGFGLNVFAEGDYQKR